MSISFAEMVERPAAPAVSEGGEAATTGPVSFAEMRGQPAASTEPSILGFLSDTQSWKDMLSTPAAVGNLLLSGPGMLLGGIGGAVTSALSRIPNPLGTTPEIRAGLSRRAAAQKGAETSAIIAEALSPLGISKILGYTPNKTVIDTAMEMLSEGIRNYGTAVESNYRYPDGTPAMLTEDVEAVFNLLMGAAGTRPVVSGVKAGVAKITENKPPPGMTTEAARATYAETPVEKAPIEPPTYGELPYRSATPIPKTPEEQAAALSTAQKNMKAALKTETPAQRTARMTINSLPEGEAVWSSGTVDYPVRVTGEPARGPDGRMYTPVLYGDTASFVPSNELKRGTVPPEVPQPLRVDYAEANEIAQTPKEQRTPGEIIRLREHLRKLGENQQGKASAEQLAWIAAGVGGALYLSQQDFDKLSPEDAALITLGGMTIKVPGGYFPSYTVEKVAKPFLKGIDIREKVEAIPGIREMTQAEQVAKAKEVYDKEAAAPRRMVRNWLTRYAGTAADPLKDITLPVVVKDAKYNVVGTKPVRWEDIIDQILKKSAPVRQGTDVPGGFTAFPNLKELPLNEASWTIGEYTAGGSSFDPRTGDPYYRPGENSTGYETVPLDRRVNEVRELMSYNTAFNDIMNHAGDYYRTLDPAKRSMYDLPRLIKETLADDAKKAKEAAAYRETSKKARVESVAGDDVVATYPAVELPERVLHRNNPSGTSAKNMVDETLPPATTKFSWVRLKKPGQFFDEGRFMGHSVGGYDIVEGQPGWTSASGTKKQNTYASASYGHGGHEAITSGKAEVYSLRDGEGNSYATFEVRKSSNGDRVITQMKGPGNQNVSAEALRYAQDFAADPKWKSVNEGDLGKIGLTLEQFEALKKTKALELPAEKPGGLIDPTGLASIAAAIGLGAYALSQEDKEGAAILGMGGIIAGRGRTPFKGIAESKLLDYVRAGSEGAASELYARGRLQIEKTARRFGPEAEDIAQRSWEKAFRAVKSGAFQGDSQFMTYLTRIVMNEGINKGKFEGRRPTVSMEEGKTAGPEGESRGGLEETLGHAETPEKAQLSRELGERIAAAMDRVDPNMRESFLLREVEGLDYAEIAERRGIPIGTVRSQISRVKESLQQMLRQDADTAMGRQKGYSTPGLAIGLGATTAGAAIGALVDPDNPLQGSVYGALAGGVLGFREGRAALKSAIASPDTALGLVSTRLGNIAPELKFSLRNNARSVLKEVERANDAVFPFLQALDKLPEDRASAAGRALMNGNTAEIMRVPELASSYPAVQRLLGMIGSELKGLGRFGEGVVGYFPRIVKDLEGLKTALGQSAKEGLEKVLLDAEASMMRKKHRGLTDVERSLVVNRYLFAPDQTSFQPGFAKSRGVKEITPELQKFYASPAESLLRYVSGAITDIQTAKFFGRDLVTSKAGKQLYNDIDSSIGSLTERLLKEGKISVPQARELRDVLKSYFEGGQQAMNPALAAVRDLSNAGLLGNVVSAATQIGDSLATVYHQGLVPTLQSLGETLIGKQRITPKQMGLINHVAEELSSGGFTGNVVQTALKYSGFQAIDMFAKGLNINAALIKATDMSRTLPGQAKLRSKYQAAFGSEMELFLSDLRERRVTDRVEQFLFSELSDAQPISRVEMPELYLKHPNGRILYQMKTYMLKQTDIVRRDAYQNIASGEPKRILEGTKNLAALATVYALSSIPGDAIKDWISGRPVEDLLSTPKLVENVLKTFGLNRYVTDKLEKGKVVETAQGIVTPPVKIFEDVGRTASSLLSKGETNWKGVSYVPVVGRPIYDRWLGGNIKREIAETGKKNQDRPAGYKIPLSPEAQAYVKSRRDAAKAEAPARERAKFEKMQSQ